MLVSVCWLVLVLFKRLDFSFFFPSLLLLPVTLGDRKQNRRCPLHCWGHFLHILAVAALAMRNTTGMRSPHIVFSPGCCFYFYFWRVIQV
ncbi:hypothetical protein V8C34DRAFT_273053 [Trichoderma compactum]